MEKNPRDDRSKENLTPEQLREQEAKKKLARPPKDKTEITIGPTGPTGPDVSIT